MFVTEPPGPVPVFDVRYTGLPVTKFIVDKDTLLKRLLNLNVNKSMGLDDCHPRVLKEAADILCFCHKNKGRRLRFRIIMWF